MSNSGSKTLTISVMQKEFQVACPAGEEESLLRAAQHLSEQMESIRSSGKVVGMDRIAIMIAIRSMPTTLPLERMLSICSLRCWAARSKDSSSPAGHAT